MSDGASAEPLIIGKIVGCFGIKGWVKIHSYTDPIENFFDFGAYKIRSPASQKSVSLEFDAGHRQGKSLVAHIKGVDDRTEAEAYKGLEVAAAAGELPQLLAGEYYWRQLQGLQVWCRDDSSPEGSEAVLLGTVDYLIETGANDVLVVKPCDNSYDQNERLIPYLHDDVVDKVDLEKGVIEVNWYLDF
ncbi:MAG: 16S rRNA processing protein RimM [Halioglobus sp.]|jgi:16S rRNA processing protein RimM